MRRGEKAAVGCVAALAVLGGLAAFLYLSGWGAIIKNMAVLGGRGTAMVNLAKRTPFVPPAGEGVREERLRAYIAACARIKPYGDRIDAWEEEHARRPRRGRGSFKGEAAGLVGDYLRELKLSLEERGMGPAEFAWIGGRMDRAARGEGGQDEAAASDRALFKRYRQELEAAALGPHATEIARGFAD